MALTAEELLAGSTLTHEISIPSDLLKSDGFVLADMQVVLHPLTVRDLQRIGKASQDDEAISAAVMIQQALVQPRLSLEQVSQLPAGLARFLVERINSISGIDTPRDELQELVQTPLARACFILAREFGWTPEEVSGMTIGQILLYLEMSRGEGRSNEGA
jgi:hypothetical protein